MRFSVPIKPDRKGFVGRECPQRTCERYFKITPGTGLKDTSACHCPYCGHKTGQDHFWTKEQIRYAKSVGVHRITAEVLRQFKKLEFDHRPHGDFDVGMRMKVSAKPAPIRYYREKRLETEVTCERCTLRYAVYGVFAFCPDCGTHNSSQQLGKSLEVVGKMLALAESCDGDLAAKLVENSLEDVVSAFDGFARAACQVRVDRSDSLRGTRAISFQNLRKARERLRKLFGFDLADAVTMEEWTLAHRCFQKRHLLAHTMGVVDASYMREIGDPKAVVGHKVRISSEEVGDLIPVVRKLGTYLVQHLEEGKQDARRRGST